MKRFWLLGLVVIIALLGVGAVNGYNKMVAMEQDVDASWAQVNTQLQRRYDLIPNLVETVRGFASHEQAAIQAVTDARAAMMGAKTPTEQAAAANELESTIGRLFVIVENYPQLKADTVFKGLMDELAGTENRINQFRMLFNDEVREFNTYVARFPAVLWAKLFGFEQRDYFDIPEAAQAAPKVQFP